MNTRDEREAKIRADFPVGAVVKMRLGRADGYIDASKLRDRMGLVVGHQIPTPNPIVRFLAVGRKKELTKVFSYGTLSDLEIVTDTKEVMGWKVEVDRVAANKAAKRTAPPKRMKEPA